MGFFFLLLALESDRVAFTLVDLTNYEGRHICASVEIGDVSRQVASGFPVAPTFHGVVCLTPRAWSFGFGTVLCDALPPGTSTYGCPGIVSDLIRGGGEW